MAAIDTNTLIEEAKCYLCFGVSLPEALRLAILARISEGGGGSGDSLPAGVIMMWSGSVATIPAGWAFCDGTNGTPDLRNRFVVAADADSAGTAMTTLTGAATQSGGSISHNHTLNNPAHGHTINDPSHVHQVNGLTLDAGTAILNSDPTGNYADFVPTQDSNSASTGITVNDAATAVSSVAASAPQPYFSLAYIMKT